MTTTKHKFLELPDGRIGTYNSWDIHFTTRLLPHLIYNLQQRQQWDYFTSRVEPFQGAVLNMARRGAGQLDTAALNTMRSRVRAELRETDQVVLDADPDGRFGLAEPTPRAPNSLGSPKRMRPFLFDHLNLKPAKLTAETSEPSLAQDSLIVIYRNLRKMDEHARPVLDALFHRSRLRTIYQRYLTVKAGAGGRIRPTVKLANTKTFRLAYSDPALHQWPEEVRHLLRAKPGHILVSADWKQLELRIQAYLYDDEPTIRVFEAGEDIHLANMVDLLGYTRELVDGMTKESRVKGRNLSKSIKYKMDFGGTSASGEVARVFCPCPRCVHKVPPVLDLSPQKIAAAERRWLRAHPAVERGQHRVAEQVQRDHYYESPFGAKRYVMAPWGRDLAREVKNIPSQFGASLLMEDRQTQLDQLGAPVILNHHDSLMVEVPEAQADLAAKQLRAVMEAPVPALGGVSFPVDVAVGYNWGKRTAENPDGLTEA